MKICLVRCPSPFLINEWTFPPLGLMSVGTSLEAQGHTVHIHDLGIDSLPLHFDYYGFGATTPEYPSAMEGLKKVKAANSSATVILGGPHATLNPSMGIADGFDAVVQGDGEFAAISAFTTAGGIIRGIERPLDEYPMIDRTLVNMAKYRYLLDGRLATTMMTSQGCPYHCAFCAKNYQEVRFRSAELVMREIDMLYGMGYRAILFPEDLFILRRARAEAICRYLGHLGIIWRCLVRGDLVVRYGQAFCHMMRETGCVEVGIGVESGSDRVLKIANKAESSATILQAIHMLKAEGIRVKGFFILGLPGETRESLEETRLFLEAAKLDNVDIKIFQPYPGTPIWNNRSQYDIQWLDATDLSTTFFKGRPGEYAGTVRTSALSTEDIYAAWIEMEAQFKNYAVETSHARELAPPDA